MAIRGERDVDEVGDRLAGRNDEPEMRGVAVRVRDRPGRRVATLVEEVDALGARLPVDPDRDRRVRALGRVEGNELPAALVPDRRRAAASGAEVDVVPLLRARHEAEVRLLLPVGDCPRDAIVRGEPGVDDVRNDAVRPVAADRRGAEHVGRDDDVTFGDALVADHRVAEGDRPRGPGEGHGAKRSGPLGRVRERVDAGDIVDRVFLVLARRRGGRRLFLAPRVAGERAADRAGPQHKADHEGGGENEAVHRDAHGADEGQRWRGDSAVRGAGAASSKSAALLDVSMQPAPFRRSALLRPGAAAAVLPS